MTFLTALIAELAGAALGFGPAVLYQISWQLSAIFGLSSGALETAVLNIVVEDAPCGLVQLFLLRQHFRPWLFAISNAPVMVALPLGTWFLTCFGNLPAAKQVLGVVFLSIAGLQVWSQSRTQTTPTRDLEERSLPVVLAVVAAMAASGLLRGALGIAGPPAMVLLLFFKVDRGAWRCIANTIRVTMLVMQGLILGGYRNDLQAECWPMYAALMSGGIIGLCLGNQLAPRVDHAMFQRWLLLFLCSGALLMLCSGSRKLSTGAAAGVAGAGLLVALAPVVPIARRIVHCGSPRCLQDLKMSEVLSALGFVGIDPGPEGKAALTPMVEQRAEQLDGDSSADFQAVDC